MPKKKFDCYLLSFIDWRFGLELVTRFRAKITFKNI